MRGLVAASYDTGATTHVGNVRERNEDSYLVRPEVGLWAVADGMGGHEAGEVASASIVEHLATAELSVGDFVLSGGEIGAVVIVDAVARYVPGVVGKQESILKDSFSDPAALEPRVEHPHYTRPAEFRGWSVPEVLISGDHEAVRKWREDAARWKTEKNRPDLVK